MRVVLNITMGPHAGQKAWLRDGQFLRVGRTERADLVLANDPALSGLHFVVECGSADCRVRDLESRNGITVNGQPTTMARLADGDRIQAGQTTLVVSITATPTPGDESDPAATQVSANVTQPTGVVTPNVAAVTPTAPPPATAPVASRVQASVAESSRSVAPSAAAHTVPNPAADREQRPATPKPNAPTPESLRARAPRIRSPKSFYVGLYLEHLEEASFLYEQRGALLRDDTFCWPDVADFDDRFEAHVDALVVGNDLALDVCRTQASDGDFGQLHAALRVFCRTGRQDLLLSTLGAIDPADADKRRAAGDALVDELPPDWQDALLGLLGGADPLGLAPIARLVGWRRGRAGRALMSAFEKAVLSDPSDIYWAFGRIHEPREADSLLQRGLQHPLDGARQAACLALLRRHHVRTMEQLAASPMEMPWALIPLGLACPASAARRLCDVASQQTLPADGILALGLAGNMACIDVLTTALSVEEQAPAAAMALELITGAGLHEQAFIPDKVDEDELFPGELAQHREGKLPPRGRTVTRLCQNPSTWREWLRHHASRFESFIRYRHGQPMSCDSLLAAIRARNTPNRMRQWAHDELVIRYGCDVRFESDMRVPSQMRAIDRIADWVQAQKDRFQPGAWYFAGEIQA